MKALSSDTRLTAEQVQIDLIRRTPVWQKMLFLNQMTQTVHTLTLSGLRQRHPTASPAELQRYLAQLWLGHELADKIHRQQETSHDH